MYSCTAVWNVFKFLYFTDIITILGESKMILLLAQYFMSFLLWVTEDDEGMN